MPTRSDIVSKAREYLGTPFLHQGRVKGKALDCVGLILCVAEELGLNDVDGNLLLRTSYVDYSPQPAGRYVHDQCRERLQIKPILNLLPGDVVTLRLPDNPTHTCIVGEIEGQGLSLIHCYNGGNNVCIEHRMDNRWQRRIVGAFCFPGVD